MTDKGVPYEAPKVTFHGDLRSLTESVLNQPNTDLLCTQAGVQVAGVPSNIVCKSNP